MPFSFMFECLICMHWVLARLVYQFFKKSLPTPELQHLAKVLNFKLQSEAAMFEVHR